MKTSLKDLLLTMGIKLTEEQVRQFAQYQQELLAWNQKINLTALTEEREILIKHFYDSLLGLKAIKWSGEERVLDVGTGAGFPGLPLKLVYPSLSVVLADSLQKRVKFLRHLSGVLGLTGLEIVHGRAEDLGREESYRGKFEVVVSRAVAKLTVLAEYCLPFVRQEGVFLAYKGGDGAQEYEEASLAIEKLGGKLWKTVAFSLPEGLGERTIICLKKVKPTPAIFPRKPGIPRKSPL